MARWDRIIALREDVKKVLEAARNAKVIGASLDAKVQLFASGADYEFLCSVKDILKPVFIVSSVEIVDGEGGEKGASGVGITVAHADGEKCERCWSYSDSVGSNSDHPTLCSRCAAVIESL